MQADFSDWWWKARLGKAYYQLGLLRDAEKQLKSSLKNQVGRGLKKWVGNGWVKPGGQLVVDADGLGGVLSMGGSG